MTQQDGFCNRAEAYEAHDDVPLSPERAEAESVIEAAENVGEAIGDVILRRYSRRDVMRGTLGVAAVSALFGPKPLSAREAKAAGEAEAAGIFDRFDFKEVEAGVDGAHHVAEGYRAEVLLRWGDPLFPDSPPFDPL